MGRKAVVLCSGGVDSSTTLAITKSEGYDIYALSFDYGQRNCREVDCAKRQAENVGAKAHLVIKIDLGVIGGSALTTKEIAVPKDRSADEIAGSIPPTYVPARNTIFLAFALAWAEVLGANDIFIGVNAIDYSGYPDCRPEYIEAFQKMARLATKAGAEGAEIGIHAPLAKMTKADIVRKGFELGVDFAWTTSCYDPDEEGRACGRCDSCLLRKKGFAEANVTDPIACSSHYI